MSWARRRKLIYIGSIIILFLLIVVLPIVIYYYKPPTCFDGKQNQDELGVDCGGVCTLLCPAQYAPLNVLWSRFSKVSDGVYNVLAYIENPNINAGANNLRYVFRLYDDKGILLKERYGQTFAPASKAMAIFEAEMQTGYKVPDRLDFSFISDAVWLKQENRETGLVVSQSVMSRLDSAPRLTATVSNKNIGTINNIEAIGVVYNNVGNTIAFSRTIIDSIAGKGSKEINFNWPKPFTLAEQNDTYTRTEIIFKVLK